MTGSDVLMLIRSGALPAAQPTTDRANDLSERGNESVEPGVECVGTGMGVGLTLIVSGRGGLHHAHSLPELHSESYPRHY